MNDCLVVDTCSLRELFTHFRRSIPRINIMWEKFENMIISGQALFVKETYHELERQFAKDGDKMKWINDYKKYFFPPTNDECNIVKEIYSHRNFQNNIARKNLLLGMPVADAFIVAKAKYLDCSVVSREKYSINSARIPNICKALGVNFIDDEEFQKLLFS